MKKFVAIILILTLCFTSTGLAIAQGDGAEKNTLRRTKIIQSNISYTYQLPNMIDGKPARGLERTYPTLKNDVVFLTEKS